VGTTRNRLFKIYTNHTPHTKEGFHSILYLKLVFFKSKMRDHERMA